MANLGYWAALVAPRFRAGLVSSLTYEGSFNYDETTLRYFNEPLLKREAHHMAIRWPTGGMGYYSPSATRGVLNALLSALGMSNAYRFTIDRADHASFWARDGGARGKWRNQNLVIGDWYPLVDGELARMAIQAERRLKHKQLEKV